MDTPNSRLPFWHALIAEAKRRARQRRFLLVLLVLVLVAVIAAVALRPSGGAPQSGGPSARFGVGTAASPQVVHFGAFMLTVPKGLHYYVGPATVGSLSVVLADHHVRTGRTISGSYVDASSLYPTNGVLLSLGAAGVTPVYPARLPLGLQKLSPNRLPARATAHDGAGTLWNGLISPSGRPGTGGTYSIMVWEGSKASAADRAEIERALRSIRRAH